MSILARLIVLVLIAALPGIGIQAYHVWKSRWDGYHQVEDKAERSLASIVEEQARVIESARALLGAVAEADPTRQGDAGECGAYFNRLAPRMPKGQSLMLVDAQGNVRCATQPQDHGGWIGNRLSLSHGIGSDEAGGEPGVGDFFLIQPQRRAIQSLIWKTPAADGAGSGYLALTLDLSWLESYLARHPLLSHAALVLANRDGLILARYPDIGTGWAGHQLPERFKPLMAQPMAGVVKMVGLDGVEQTVAYSPALAGGNGAFIALGLRATDAGVAIGMDGPWELMAAAGNLVAVLLVAWLGARRLIQRPVWRLMRAVDRWRLGDHTARAGLRDTGSEIGRLGAAFDAMATELQARDALREAGRAAERRMAAVLASTTDGVLEIDRSWRVTFMNDRARSLLSQGADRTGAEIWEVLPLGTEDEARSNLQTGMRNQMPVEFEISQEILGTCYALRAFPTAEGLALYVQDVTIRHRAERVVRRAEARYRAILETAADAMVLIDGKGIVQAFNRAAEKLFGYSSVEVVGRSVSLLLPDPDPSATEHYIIRCGLEQKDGGSTSREITARRRDGSGFVADLAVAEWHDGEIRQFTGIIRDISDRLAVQEGLRVAKEEAERAVLAKSRFLAAASHDLRQPLQSLMFFAAAAGEQLRGHTAYGTLEAMQQALNAMKRLLDGLLDISRLDAGAVTPHPGTVALGALLARLKAEYGPQAERRGIRLRIPRTSVNVTSDAALLERILRNLLENALRYTPRGTILMGCRRRGASVRVMVCDTGIGIPPERQEEIFEEFTQLGNAERDREQGLGLGLAIVRRLCRLLKHPIALRSAVGRGSAFAIDLPRTFVSASGLPADTAQGGGAVEGQAEGGDESRRLILVIDDEVIILMGLRVMLEEWGYDVMTATGGDEAVRLLAKHARCPDAVIADYRLRHGHTGSEALHAVHAHCGRLLPSIVLTGDTAPERIQEAHASGFSIIHKPVSAVDLRRLIESALQTAAE